MNTNTGSAVPSTNARNPVSGLVSGLGGTTGQATSDAGNTGGHLLSNVANTIGNTLKGTGNMTSSTGGPLGTATGAALGGTGSAIGNTGSATGGLTSKVANAVGGAVNALSGNAPHGQHHLGQAPLGQAPIGTQNFGQAPVGTAGTFPQQVAREVHVAPTVLVEKVEKPVIVKETILPQEKIEVQPVIHREREQLEVHEVVQPLHERDIAPTSMRQATLPAEIRPEIRESDTAFQTSYRAASTRYVPEVHTEAVQREVLSRPAIVEEHVHRKIVEEVQPVLYKETITPVIIEETKPIYEKIVEAPRIVEEVRPMVDLGTRHIETPMSNLSLGGQPSLRTSNIPLGQTQMPLAGQPMMTSSMPYGGQPVASSFPREVPLGGQPHKETTITQETYVEPARATSHPHTQTKRII